MLTQADNGRTIEAQPGARIVVTLPENPTTGYSWAMDGEGEALPLVSSEYAATPAAGVGGGGKRTLVFEAKTPGTASLRLKRWREWEGEASVRERYAVTVQVKAG
jgi:inhibitor of cysteine peptidase